MQISISFPIKDGDKILVVDSQRIESGSPLLEEVEIVEQKIINLAESLKIKKDKIGKYLTRNIGEDVQEGEVIAEKKGFLGKFILKSPFNGKIASINLKTGEVLIEEKKKKKRILKAPVSGRVKLKKDKIEILFNSETFFGKKGYGKVEGKLFKIKGEKIGVLQIPAESSGKILLGLSFNKDALPKIEALGGKGIVSLSLPQKIKKLPYLLVGEKEYEKIKKLDSKEAILDGEEKKLIVVI